jgi:membrane fusion protein (multidrug efflux system)
MRQRHLLSLSGAVLCGLALVGLLGCGDDESSSAEAPAGGGGRPSGSASRPGGAGGFPGAPGGQAAAVPVETAAVERREISSYIETNGTLEAENEVDIIARVAAPVVELRTEEGMAVRKGQVLARLEEDELRARLEISRVALKEAELAHERARLLNEQQLISAEEFEQTSNRFETAKAQLEGDEILINYTVIKAPFDGLIVARYVDLAQQVAVNSPLFRISDFDPLLCPIQVAERELPMLATGQPAYVQVEAWGDERFQARVLRISPVVDAATGTIKVTLEVQSQKKLRPGMFTRAYLQTASKPSALVIPKAALSLESIGDTVYVASDGKAVRREVELGFQEGDSVEILDGLAEGERVIVVGQDGLSDGTPIQMLDEIEGAPPEPQIEARSPQ